MGSIHNSESLNHPTPHNRGGDWGTCLHSPAGQEHFHLVLAPPPRVPVKHDPVSNEISRDVHKPWYATCTRPPSPSHKAYLRAWWNMEPTPSFHPCKRISITVKSLCAPPGPLHRGSKGPGTGSIRPRQSKIALTVHTRDTLTCRTPGSISWLDDGKSWKSADQTHRRSTCTHTHKYVHTRPFLRNWPSRLTV